MKTQKLSGVTKLITLAKTQTALANQLGISQAAIQLWANQDYVPQKRIAQVIELYPQMTEEELINPVKMDTSIKQIIAYIPERKQVLKFTTRAPETRIYPARTEIFLQDSEGHWSSPDHGPMTQADVIDICKNATNWPDIKSMHFPMYGFHA